MLTTISGSLPPSSLYALAECEWLAKSIPPVSLMPSASSSLILETIGLRSIPNPADRDWLCEYIDSQPIATRQARFGLGRDNNITPLGFTVPVAGYLLEKSIRNCEGPECSLGKAAAIAITELLSGVIGDRDSQKKPSGAHDQQWDRRRVASSALAHLATIAVDSVACNPPLVLALLNLLQPCIIPLYDRLGKDQLAAIGGVDGQPMTMESLSNRHYYINAPGGFDKLFLPIVQLTMAMACSNKFRPMVIADIYAPENRIYFERWFAEQHPGKAIPPLVDVEVKLSPDVVANMVTKKDHSLFAYCNSNRSAGAFDNRISIVRALVAKYPQMSTLARFVLYNTRSGKSHIFLACAVFWCIYEEQLQNWYQGLAASKMQPSTNNNNNSASVSSWLKSLGWLTPMNLSAFRYTTFDPTTRKKVVHVTAKKEAMALRLGLYELSLTPNYICAMSMPLWKSKGATRLRTRIGSKLNLVAPEFATLYRRLQTYYLISRHAGEEMMAMAVGEEEEAEEAAAIVVVD